MKNIKIKSFLFLILIISAMAWILVAYLSGLDLSDTYDFLKIIPTVVTIDTIIITLFIQKIWKWRIFKNWLVHFPDLNGTWTGNIYSDWIDPKTNKGIAPIPVMLTVNQTFFHISCVMRTQEMKSFSLTAGFNIDHLNQIKHLSYIYTSKPRIVLNQRSLPNDGAVIFEIIESDIKKLSGRYWTDRNTKGEIIVSFFDKKRLEELPDFIGDHPVTEDEHRR